MPHATTTTTTTATLSPTDLMGHAWAILVGEQLQQHKRAHVPFGTAWALATALHKPPKDTDNYPAHWTPAAVAFARKHFEAAYVGHAVSRRGLEPPDTCSATLRGGERTDTASAFEDAGSQDVEGHPVLAPSERRVVRCASGDDCARPAGHGHTGKFCAIHASDLARIAEMPEMVAARYGVNPKKSSAARVRGTAASHDPHGLAA